MKVVYSKNFLKASVLLPIAIQKKLDGLLALVAENPFHPFLHTKKLIGPLEQQYSFRITRDWRAIFVFLDKGVIQMLNVGNRKDIYR